MGSFIIDNEDKQPLKKFIIGREIGRGSFGAVYLITHKKTGKRYRYIEYINFYSVGALQIIVLYYLLQIVLRILNYSRNIFKYIYNKSKSLTFYE